MVGLPRRLGVFKCEFFLSYGMTECCGKISTSLVDAATRQRVGPARTRTLVQTSGRPFRLLEVRVVRGAGAAVPADETDARDVQPVRDGGGASNDVHGDAHGDSDAHGDAHGDSDVHGDAHGDSDVGEVWIRGPTLFGGYHENAEATAAAITPKGWFRTGDLATMNEEGYLTITDRAKDMILVGSENVYSVEVERALHDHPGVTHACVHGGRA